MQEPHKAASLQRNVEPEPELEPEPEPELEPELEPNDDGNPKHDLEPEPTVVLEPEAVPIQLEAKDPTPVLGEPPSPLTFSFPKLTTNSTGFLPPLATSPIKAIDRLTEEERTMTVEQWIRHEMNIQYQALKRDGELRIEAFKRYAAEVREQIENL